jgi:NTE family protein
MNASDFFDDPRVLFELKQLRRDLIISDIVERDAEGQVKHQYVDLVMEGGGVLGIALVGYVHALEQAGVRFLGIGGTSAGAINAVLTAAADAPDRIKSPKVVELLANMDLWSFVDGDDDARDFVKAAVNDAPHIWLLWKGAQVIDNINDHLGLNPGEKFRGWLHASLQGFGVKTVAELEARMHLLPTRADGALTLEKRAGGALSMEEASPRLAIVAADVTTKTKAIFPEMANLYWRNPERLSPAALVRASMSIPIFFHPLRVGDVPQNNREAWEKQARYSGDLPREVVFVDGGILSNFPIDLFHAPGVPMAPTLGVKLGVARMEAPQLRAPGDFLTSVFNASRFYSDIDFLRKNPDYGKLVSYIETGDHHWLQFDMGEEEKIDLFLRGVKAGVKFLNQFEWEKYKDIRRSCAEAVSAARA